MHTFLRSSPLNSPAKLFSHPMRWAASHLIAYAVTSIVVAGVFLVATGVYALFLPSRSLPTIPINLIFPETPQPSLPDDGAGESLMVSGKETLKLAESTSMNKKVVGFAVVDSSNQLVGSVKSMTRTKTGKEPASVEIMRNDGAVAKVKADAIKVQQDVEANVKKLVLENTQQLRWRYLSASSGGSER